MLKNYRELYYNGDRKRETIWYAFLASRTYTECYNILLDLFEEKRARKVMEEVIKLNSNIYLMSELEEERYNELAFISATNHAKEEGKEEGIKQGKEEGIKQGKEEGIKQGKEKTIKELIKNMLYKNMDINLISEVANVSIDKINEIRKEIYN